MTIIIGALDGKGGIVMGCDSAGVNSTTKELQLRADSKIFKNGEYLIGVCGSWRVNQILRYTELPPYPKCNPHEHLVKNFLPWLKLTLPPEDDSYGLLVGLAGRLFHIYNGHQVSEEIAPYEATGSGSQLARAAMYAADKSLPIEKQIENALEACERFHLDIRRPWRFLHS